MRDSDLSFWVLQVPPFRKLRQEKTKGRKAKLKEMAYYDWQQMRTAFTGSLPMIGEANPYAGKVCSKRQKHIYFQQIRIPSKTFLVRKLTS